MQDLVNAVGNESFLDSDYGFSSSGVRNRNRHNHNSRKKYSSVSSRQREGGSLPSNVNVTNYGALLNSTKDHPSTFISEPTGASAKQQRRKANANTNTVTVNEKDTTLVNASGSVVSSAIVNNNSCSAESGAAAAATAVAAAALIGGGAAVANSCSSSTNSSGDCVIEIPQIEIHQQQQQILKSKAHGVAGMQVVFSVCINISLCS